MATFTQEQFDRLLANMQFVDLVANGAIDEGGTGIVESPGGELVRTAAKVINDIADTESTVLGYRNDALAAQSAAEVAQAAAEEARDEAEEAVLNGAATSGTYTATLTDVLNTSARDMPTPANYMRVGNCVTVFGKVDVTQTISGDWFMDITPPIASAMTEIFDAVGFINAATTTDKGNITANPLSGKISFAGNSTSIISKQWYFNFSYVIKT